jgi:glutamine synthetase
MHNYIYIWTDAAGHVRSKVRRCEGEATEWSYDGSSTGQATTESSEVILLPRMKYGSTGDLYQHVLCSLKTPDSFPVAGDVFGPLNPEKRVALGSARFAFEQEFFIYDKATEKPILIGEGQGPYYCSVGSLGPRGVENLLREVFEKAIAIGINCTGYNLEVAPSQVEIQVDGPAFRAACDLVMLRYLLWEVLGSHGFYPVFDPKPLGPTFNGSGLHTNISTKATMATGGFAEIERIMSDLSGLHATWMPRLGAGNEARLTGKHETSSMDCFTWAVGSRASSVRIPYSTARGLCGYFEDRRPAANANPFQILALYADVLSKE